MLILWYVGYQSSRPNATNLFLSIRHSTFNGTLVTGKSLYFNFISFSSLSLLSRGHEDISGHALGGSTDQWWSFQGGNRLRTGDRCLR